MASSISDIVLHILSCSVMVTGSSLVEDENFSTSRITDAYVGCVCGVLVTGAGTVEDEWNGERMYNIDNLELLLKKELISIMKY